jgi:hypothetical protein
VATVLALATAFAAPAVAEAGSGGIDPTSAPPAPVAGSKAKLMANGLARAPADAPAAVKRAISAANSIDNTKYCLGGGHKAWKSRCYDCSGAVSYVLGPKGADILKAPLPSGDFKRWGEAGRGGWITVHYNAGHVFVEIAGLRWDTSQPDDGKAGPGWSKDVKAGYANGPFKRRYFPGL